MYFFSMESEYDRYPFFGEINNKKLFNFNVYFYLLATCKKAYIHDTSKMLV